MKKFEFTMHKVLDLKNTVLDEEKNRLGQLQAAVRLLEDQQARFQQACRELEEEMRAAQAEGITIAELLGYNARKNNLHMQLKELEGRLEKARERADAQLQKVIEASKEVSKLEKVEERQYEVYREGEKKAESARVEELVANNVCRRQVV